MICNGDEGDPGAFMDRSVLESDPQRVLEGMALAAYAVGASKGFVYVRAEYPLAVACLTNCLREARRRGLLGNNICNTSFNFDVEIRLGAERSSVEKRRHSSPRSKVCAELRRRAAVSGRKRPVGQADPNQ